MAGSLALATCENGPTEPDGPGLPPIASVTVIPTTETIAEAMAIQLTVEVRDTAGAVLVNQSVSWSTSDASVATVSDGGLVTGLRAGTATISGEAGRVTGSARITVVTPSPVACGDLAAGSLGAAGESDFFAFTAQAGEVVFLTLVQTGGFGGASRARATLFSPSGAQLDLFDANAQRRQSLPASGTYVVRVQSNDRVTTGSYNLGLECLGSVGTVAVPLALGDVGAGSLDTPGTVDLFTFDGRSNDIVFLTLVQTGGFGGSSRARATLLSPAGEQLDAFDANGQRRVTLPANGQYVIAVQTNDLVTTGSYRLGLEGLNPLSPGAVALTLGALEAGSVNASADVDFFTFEGQADEVVFLTLVQTGGFGGSSRAQATLFSPSGERLDLFDANGQRRETLPTTGTYVVRVQTNNLVTPGSYALGLEGLDPLSPGSTTLTLGAVEAGSLARAAEIDFFTFEGEAGDIVFLTLVQTGGFGGSSRAQATLFSPTSERLDVFDANGRRRETLPVTGTYVVRVQTNNLVTTGAYALGFEGLSPLSPESTALEPGALEAGSLGRAADADFFTFDGNAGDIVFLTLVQTGGFGGSSRAQATLFSPAGEQLDLFDANGQQRETLPASGTYVVRVQTNNLVTTGSYNLGLESLSPLSPGSTALALGTLEAGSLGQAGEVDFFTFAGNGGDIVFLTLVQTGGFGGSSRAQGTLFSPTGERLDVFDANGQRRETLPAAGTYVVRVQTNNLVTPGSYNLGLEGLGPLTPGATAMSLGALEAGSLGRAGEVDFFTFNAQAGDIVFLTLVQTGGFGGSSRAQGTLFSPTGERLDAFDANGQRRETLPSTGTYVVRVQTNNLVTPGSYNLGLEGLAPLTPGAFMLSAGATASGTIDRPGDVDFFTFTVAANATAGITLTQTGGFGGSSRAQATVFSPTAQALVSFDANAVRELTLQAAGTYVIRVQTNNLVTTGSYDVTFELR